MSHTEDKRRHPRVAHRIRVRSQSLEAVEFETVDLSVGGLSCTAPVSLPPMTKLALSLSLPEPEGRAEREVRGEAVVVRSEKLRGPKANGRHRVALFFSRMEEADRQALLGFLKSRTP